MNFNELLKAMNNYYIELLKELETGDTEKYSITGFAELFRDEIIQHCYQTCNIESFERDNLMMIRDIILSNMNNEVWGGR